MDEVLLSKIENILNIEFHKWQKQYLLDEPMVLDMRITGRATGKTLVFIVKKLFESPEPLDLRKKGGLLDNCDWWSVEYYEERALLHPYMNWYKNKFQELYLFLNDKGIKTREVLF